MMQFIARLILDLTRIVMSNSNSSWIFIAMKVMN
jgi:hypothetical protein